MELNKIEPGDDSPFVQIILTKTETEKLVSVLGKASSGASDDLYDKLYDLLHQ